MKIVLHLGAHKTASTYIQQVLYHNQRLLQANKVGLIGPDEVRGKVDAPGRLFAALFKKAARAGPGRIARHVTAASRAGQRRVIITEENLIGHLNALLMGDWCYGNAMARLQDVLSGLEEKPSTVLLAVRSYASFFPSSYAQAIRSAGFVPFDAELRHRLTSLDRGWADLVRDVARVMPSSTQLVVWAYEDMGTLEHEIFRLLAGAQVADNMTTIAKRPMPGPTRAAIRRLHNIAREQGPPPSARVRQVLRFNSRARGLAPFDPWSPHERAQLEARYAADLARIEDEFPGSRLRGAEPLRQSGVSM